MAETCQPIRMNIPPKYIVVCPSCSTMTIHQSYGFGAVAELWVRLWLIRPILARKVRSQFGHGIVWSGSILFSARSFLACLLDSAALRLCTSQVATPFLIADRHDVRSLANVSQESTSTLNALSDDFRVSLKRFFLPP